LDVLGAWAAPGVHPGTDTRACIIPGAGPASGARAAFSRRAAMAVGLFSAVDRCQLGAKVDLAWIWRGFEPGVFLALVVLQILAILPGIAAVCALP
jgi:hypothetical protein